MVSCSNCFCSFWIKPITAKIHLRLKTDPVRGTTQYKARCVGRGFCQVNGLDYQETYSPVAKFNSILTLLTVAAHYDYEIHQLDYDAAFLNAQLKEEVYIQPLGNLDPKLPPNHVYKLHKTLYGLKQSSRERWLLLRDTLKDVGWSQLFTDQCVFKRSCVSRDEFLAVYVDDLIILSPTPSSMTKSKLELLHLFERHG